MKKSLLKKTMLLLFALVTGSTCAWADTVTKTENFSSSAATSDQYDCSSNITTATNQTDWDYVWTPSGSGTVFQHGIKLGASSKTGTVTNATMLSGIATGTSITIKVYAAVWNTDGGSLKLTYNGSSETKAPANAAITSTSSTYSAAAFSSSTDFTITKVADVTSFSIASTAKRILIDKVEVVYEATAANLSSISLSGTYQTEFEKGSEFNHDGLTVTAHYDNSSTADVSSKATFSGYDMNTLGDQTVTVSYTEGGITKTATYDITVVPVPTAIVTLDFTNAGWGFPADYKTSAATYTNNGYTISLGASSNGHKKVISSETIVSLIFGKKDATLTLPAFGFNVSKLKVYGQSGAGANVTFNVYVGDDAVSTAATSSKEDHEFVIAADKRAVGTLYTIKVTNAYNCQISKIEVYGNGCEAGVVTDAGWATYVTTCDMEFAEGDAFVVSAANATTATLTGVTKIRANQPVILKGEGAKTAKVLDEAPAAVSNELAISIGGSIDGFVLAKPAGKSAGFYKWNGGSLTSGKVYLPAPTAARDYLEFTFDDETTSISEIETMRNVGNETFYNFNGQKVQNPTKGLYIVNGKKVIIK